MPKIGRKIGRTTYSNLCSVISLSVLCAGGLVSLTSVQALAQGAPKETGAPLDFSFGNAGWVTVGTEWTAVPGGPRPVDCDPAHPCVPNNTGRQPTFRVANVGNPNLTQFAKDALKKINDEVLRGKPMYVLESRCWATGIPSYLLNPGGPTYWVQTPEKIVTIWQMDHQVRHIYLNVPHSADPKSSWYGESVGHFEGNTLVVDTIGQNARTFVDNYRTPHSDKLHVVERYRMLEGGKMMEADITMEDPAVFLEPLHVTHRWRRIEGTLVESTCAEGEMNNPFQQDADPIPRADKPDF
jgi:hypothetical protein